MKNFKRVLALVLSVVMVLGSMTMAFAETKVITPDIAFSDMDYDYETAVAKLKAVEVIDGYADGSINLGGTLSRAEMAKIVVALLGLDEGASLTAPNRTNFSDLYDGFWANDYINVASSLGIIVGHQNGTFDPHANVTEEQAVTMVLRALEWDQIITNTGLYPLPQTSKALELGLVEKAPIYGKEATRGYAFSVAAEALTVPMARRSATANNVVYEGEGSRTILGDFLKVASVTNVVDKTARMEREYDLNEFQIDQDTFIFTNKEVDATEYLGEVVNVWYEYNKVTKENEVIYAEVDSVDSNKVNGTVTEISKSEITIDGRTYSFDEDAVIYRENRIRTMPKVGDFVTLTLDKKNNVVFADAFDLTVADTYVNEEFNLVFEIEKVENGTKTESIRFKDQNGDTRTITNEKIVVYKDGKIGDVEDIKDLDLVKELKSDKSKTTLIYAIEASQTGKIEKVVFDSKAKKQEDGELTIVLNDTDILVNQANFVITGAKVGEAAKDEGKATDFNVDLAYALREYVKKDKEGAKDVTVFVMPNGKAAMLVTDIAPKEVKSAMVYQLGRKYDTWNATETAGVNFLTHEGNDKMKEVFFTGLKDTSLNLYSFKDINGEHKVPQTKDVAGNVDGFSELKYDGKQVTVYTKGVPALDKGEIKKENDPRVVKLGTTADDGNNKEVKSLKNFTLGVDGKHYNVTNSTVFYNLNDKQDAYTVEKYDDLKDTKINNAYVRVFVDPDTANHETPVANIVVVTSGYFETKDKDFTYGVISTSWKSGGHIIYVVDTGGDEDEEFAYKANDKIDHGTAVRFRKTDEKVGEIVKIKDITKGEEGRLTNINRGLYTIDRKVYDVASNSIINISSYDSNVDYMVSYWTETDKIKALNVLRVVKKSQASDVETGLVTFIDKGIANVNDIAIEVTDKNGNYTEYTRADRNMSLAVAQFLKDNVDFLDGTNMAFSFDTRGNINGVTFISLNAATTSHNLTIPAISAFNKLELDGNGKAVTGTIEVKADDVTVRNIKGTGTIIVAAGVTKYTLEDSTLNVVDLNGGGFESVYLNNVTVDTINVKEKVKVELDRDTNVTLINVTVADAKIVGFGTVEEIVSAVKVEVDEKLTVENGKFAPLKLDNASPVLDTVTGDVYGTTFTFTEDIEVVDGFVGKVIIKNGGETIDAVVAAPVGEKLTVSFNPAELDATKAITITIAAGTLRNSTNDKITNSAVTVTYEFKIDRWERK